MSFCLTLLIEVNLKKVLKSPFLSKKRTICANMS